MPSQFIRPTVCFGGNPCNIEVDVASATLVGFVSKCSAHVGIQSDNALTDPELFAAIMQSDRRKEVARLGAKLFRNIDEDLDFTIDADGTIHIATGLNDSHRAQLDSQVQMVNRSYPVPRGTQSVVID